MPALVTLNAYDEEGEKRLQTAWPCKKSPAVVYGLWTVEVEGGCVGTVSAWTFWDTERTLPSSATRLAARTVNRVFEVSHPSCNNVAWLRACASIRCQPASKLDMRQAWTHIGRRWDGVEMGLSMGCWLVSGAMSESEFAWGVPIGQRSIMRNTHMDR